MATMLAPKKLALVALLALAGCAGFEPAGRSADDQPIAAAPPPPEEAPPFIVPPAPPPPPAASAATVPTPQPVRPASGEEVVVPGTTERQVAPPDEDPRSVTERAADLRAWDDCVLRAQGRSDGDPMSPSLETPEDVCRERLGMASRRAVPDSRR